MSRRMFFSSPNSGVSNVYTIYDQILEDTPSEIRAYNGKRKLILQEGQDNRKVIEMYRQGAEKLTNHALLKERLAKEYYRVLSGNKSVLKDLPTPYNNPKDLLKSIKMFLESAKELDQDNNQISIQLDKLEELSSLGFFSSDCRVNKQIKQRTKDLRIQRRQEIAALDSTQLRKQLSKIKKRMSNLDRKKDQLITEKRYIRTLQKEKKFKDSVEQAVQYYTRNPKDIDGLKLVRITLKKNKRFDLLETIERENQKHQNSFWAKLSLIDVLLKRVEVNNKKNYSEIADLIEKLKDSGRLNREKYEIKFREIRLSVLSNQSPEQKLLEVGGELVGISKAYKVDRFIRECVYYFENKKMRHYSIMTLNLVLKSDLLEQDNDNQLLSLIEALSEFRISDTEQDKSILQLRDKLLNS
ncbi:hypothetical protein HMPREF9715_01149 [Myroides odoratimimus CIP 101113]|uniref:Uncharacterized protein n=2 Tax=Myroides odoratimimus TaxID=76832 RepID=A0AAV3F4P0_9FLAO|nr:hypothetical protein HMPREF9715_01149 [Myroides odoratimimus CIP 101113]SHL81077.1 hypothetical protein SAMN05444275_106279 [Myroides odoratimimus subsp. xuanwuensis]